MGTNLGRVSACDAPAHLVRVVTQCVAVAGRGLALLIAGLLIVACGDERATPTTPSPVSVVTLAGLAAEPPSVSPRGSMALTVTLSGPAPDGGLAVALALHEPSAPAAGSGPSDEHTTVQLPASLTVPAGAARATVVVDIPMTAAGGTLTIVASAGGQSRTLEVPVTQTVEEPTPPVTLAELVVDPSFVGGQTTRGTVRLTETAPNGGFMVQLSSDRAEAQVPASVTVAAGETSATFPITSAPVTAATRVTLTAAVGDATRTATLELRAPPVPPTLTEISPREAGRGDVVAVTLTGTKFVADRTTVTIGTRDIAVSQVTVISATRLTAVFTIHGGATITEYPVTVTTPEGTSNEVRFRLRNTAVSLPSGSQTFSLTGGTQTFTVPAGITALDIQVFGAEGGQGHTGGAAGGRGGSVTASLAVTPGESLAIIVGGAGGVPGPGVGGSGGFNGGALGGHGGFPAGLNGAGGGGGASEIRRGATQLLVAGGGGGGGGGIMNGGVGGGGGTTIGGAGSAGGPPGGTAGQGGTQVSGGARGTGVGGVPLNGVVGTQGAGGAGAPGTGGGGGGGGGGYFGGGGGGNGGNAANRGGGGGGGSSFAIGTANNVTHQQGVRSGNGSVIISW